MFFPSRARLASRRPPMHRRRNLENYVIPALRVRGSRLAIHATVCRAAGDLEAWRNKILTIFAPYTFLRNQGQNATCASPRGLVSSTPNCRPFRRAHRRSRTHAAQQKRVHGYGLIGIVRKVKTRGGFAMARITVEDC